MTNREVVVLSAVRTPVGKFGGALKDTPPTELAASVVSESVRRFGLSAAEIGNVVFGNVIHTEGKDMYLARVAAVRGGLPVETAALTLNRLCGSGLQAIVTAAQMIVHGDADAAIGGGAESMSRAPYWLNAMRWGAENRGTIHQCKNKKQRYRMSRLGRNHRDVSIELCLIECPDNFFWCLTDRGFRRQQPIESFKPRVDI